MVQKVCLTLALLCLALALSEAKVYGQIPTPRSYLFVEIRDTSGQPVTDASVTLYGADGKQISSRTTGNESKAGINFPIRTDHHYNLLISRQGFHPSEHVFFPKRFNLGVRLVEKIPIGIGDAAEANPIVLRKPPTTAADRRAFDAQELQTQLILAAKRGDSLRTSKLLQMGVAADTVDGDGTSALLWASFAGDADTINILIERGAHVRTKHPLSSKALLIYLAEGIVRDRAGTTSKPNDTLDEIFKRQRAVINLIKAGADVNAKDLELGTTLNAALRAVPDSLPATTVEELIKAGANVNTPSEVYRFTPLMWASQSGSVEAVAMLLKAGALVEVKDNMGKTPLMWAQVTPGYPGHPNPEVVRALINAGANVNTTDPDGVTALILAARADLTESIKLLLAKGAEVNAKDRWGNSPLSSAFDSHYYSHADKDTVHHPTPLTIRTLLAAGADIHAGNSVGIPTLMLAARTDSVEALKMLLNAGAQINATDKNGRTVLMFEKWSYMPSVEVFRILLDAKADPNAVAPDGRTPLMFATYGAPPEIIELLLQRGAKASVNARDNSGQTALMHAAYYSSSDFKPEDQLRIVKALIAAGADVNIKDNSGRTPLAVAQEYSRNEALIELLKSKQRN